MSKKSYFIISLVCVVFLVIITGIVFGVNNNEILLTFYSSISNEYKTIKMSKGSSVDLNNYNINIDGYEFIGWFNDSTLNNKIDDDYVFTVNNSIYAGYSKVVNIKDINNLNDENMYSYTIVSDGNINITNEQIKTLLNLGVKRIDLSKCSIRNNSLDIVLFNNSLITEIILPKNIEVISENSFLNCYNLKNITLPNDLLKLETKAFNNCPKLESINFNDKLLEIEENAIYCCNKLIEINLPKSLNLIKTNFITNCENLENINIDSDNINYTSINGVLYTSDLKKLIKYPENKSSELILNNNTVYIEDYSCINSKITKIEITGNLEYIGISAFEKCENLEEVIINNSTNYILKESCFFDCKNLINIKLAKGLSIIEDKAFKDCKSLKNLEIINSTASDNLVKLGNSSFEGCESLEEFCIPSSVENIGNNIFYNCYNLKKVKIEANIFTLKSRMFFNCNNIENIDIKSNIKNIEDCVFYNCYNLKNITGLENVEELGNRVFYNCKSVEIIKLPKVKIINEASFYNCISVTTINLESITNLSNNIFENCYCLENLILGTNLQTIGEECINNSPNLLINIIDNQLFKYENGLILSNDKSILYWYNKTNETEITLPQEVKFIYNNALSYKDNLINIFVEEGNLNFKSIDGMLISSDYKLLSYPSGRELKTLSINENINEIQHYSIQSDYLENIFIGENVKNIQAGSIINVQSLKTITLPFLGNSNKIEEDYNYIGYIFYSENNEEDINYSVNKFLPETLTEVSITNEENLDDMAFYGASYLSKVNLSNNIKNIGAYAFFACQNLETINIEGNIEFIGESAFQKCTSLTNIYIGFYRNLELSSDVFKNNTNKINIFVYYNIGYVMTISTQTAYKNKFVNSLQSSKYWVWRFITREV